MNTIIWRIEVDKIGFKTFNYVIKDWRIDKIYDSNECTVISQNTNKRRKHYQEKRASINNVTLLSIYYLNDNCILVIKIKHLTWTIC